jgi:hypothetical protein
MYGELIISMARVVGYIGMMIQPILLRFYCINITLIFVLQNDLFHIHVLMRSNLPFQKFTIEKNSDIPLFKAPIML